MVLEYGEGFRESMGGEMGTEGEDSFGDLHLRAMRTRWVTRNLSTSTIRLDTDLAKKPTGVFGINRCA